MIRLMVNSTPPAAIELGYEVWRSGAGVMLSFNYIQRDAFLAPGRWREDQGTLRFEIGSVSYALADLPKDALAAFASEGILVVEFGALGPVGEHWAQPRA